MAQNHRYRGAYSKFGSLDQNGVPYLKQKIINIYISISKFILALSDCNKFKDRVP